MPIWVGAVVVPFCVLAVNLFVQFYFRFVPNIEDQKRHLRGAVWWVFDVLNFSIQLCCIYFLWQSKAPVTPSFVVATALSVCGLTCCLILIGFRRLLAKGILQGFVDNFGGLQKVSDRHLDSIGELIGKTGKLIDIAAQHEKALRLIASDPKISPETIKSLNVLMKYEFSGDGDHAGDRS